MSGRLRRILLTWLVVAAASLGFSSPLWAQRGGLFLELDTQYERSAEPQDVHGLRDVQSVGLAIDAYGGAENAGLAAFVDGHFGGGLQGGFAYRVTLLPLGLAIYRQDQLIGLAVATGLQLQGVTAHQPLGVQVPIRASLHLRAGNHLLLALFASNDFSLGSRRDTGSQHALFGDELRMGVSLRVGSGGKRSEGRKPLIYGSGYFVGAFYAERLGTEFWGLSLGHGMDMHGG